MLLAALFAFGAAACGNAAHTEEKEIAFPEPTPEIQPATGGEIRMPIPINADITDPLKVNTEEMLSFFSLVFESLISINESGKLVAMLAENWSVDDTGKIWTVNLRSGIFWSDGTPLTASDVKLTFSRLKTMGEDSYYDYCAQRIDSIEIVDSKTLKVTMAEKGYCALYTLTFPIMKAGTAAPTPIGTGPYCVTAVASQRVTLTANEDWWKQRPYIDTIVFLERDSNETALASYSAGQLTMVHTSSTNAGKFRQEGVTTVLDIMTQNAELMLLNSNTSALQNVNVRKAIAYALDRGKIISNVYMNRAQACDVPVPPDSWVYDVKSKVYDYNLAKAQTLLEEAGWADMDGDGVLEKDGNQYNKFKLTLLVNESSTDTTRKDAANLIAAQLAELGIQTEVVMAAYSATDTQSEFLTKLQGGEYDLALIGIKLGRDVDLMGLMTYKGKSNYGNYSSGTLLTLASGIVEATDETAYQAAASQFQLKFVEELPFITLYFRLNSLIYASKIQKVTGARDPSPMRNVDKWYINTVEDDVLAK